MISLSHFQILTLDRSSFPTIKKPHLNETAFLVQSILEQGGINLTVSDVLDPLKKLEKADRKEFLSLDLSAQVEYFQRKVLLITQK